MKLIWKMELVVISQLLIWQLLFLVTSITFIVNSKFYNLLLLEGKWFTSYYVMRSMVLFIQQSPEQTETCSAVFGNFR